MSTSLFLPYKIELGLQCVLASGASASSSIYTGEDSEFLNKPTIEHVEPVLGSGLVSTQLSDIESFFKDCYLCSINSINKNLFEMYQIKNELPPFVDLYDEDKVLGFMDEHIETIDAVNSLLFKLKNEFDPEAKLALYLMDAGEDWKTLFIEVNTKQSWESISEYRSLEWDRLYESFPKAYNIINFQFC